ncbi:conserved hypothetical protein [Altererythrobacter sp. B11]|uniref:PilZ domain-containing protein n=1 Tax=Altererythrobacter sp. B11 TaxID=2060312 RepID=UPI000DC6F54E|nr:PilZ domain-containing protein [Altererythrobacter sp. B11]BBC72456.1 conserved hypothetical protein [Altererythrobacter sp. B11]
MSGLTMIRARKRFAVKRPVGLCPRDGGKPARGLMIELSSEGCRVSKLGFRNFSEGEKVTLNMGQRPALTGFIRWAHDGIAGVRFERALHMGELLELVNCSRGEEEDARRYGT